MRESVCNLIILMNIICIVLMTIVSWPTSFLAIKIIEVVLITDGILYLLYNFLKSF